MDYTKCVVTIKVEDVVSKEISLKESEDSTSRKGQIVINDMSGKVNNETKAAMCELLFNSGILGFVNSNPTQEELLKGIFNQNIDKGSDTVQRKD